MPDSAEVNKENFKTTRLEKIGKALREADAQLVNANMPPYGMKLLRFFEETEATGKKIIDILTDKHLIYFNESIDTITCRYKNDIRLGFANSNDINDLVKYTDLICLKAAIDDLVTKRLLTENEVNTSFPEIFTYLCNHCANTRTVARMISECDDINNCRQLFFEKGGYRLTLLSTLILDALCSQLHKSPNVKYTVIFQGYTDPAQVGNIPYDGIAHVTDVGKLLPDKNIPAREITTITDNLSLSFARGGSCYEHITRKPGMDHLKIFYTGYGVNNDLGLDDTHRRSVEIKIIKEN
ncbi:hypothetical protein L3C95_16520 [Chitinophaga filiformis]|uniref:hypothetical protein n=1 Tax=Chitinophaga filiformis TaxID=104663 RepID=UPI001F2ED50E|nr:hypothetical protein [Chitinophaga filiformis]MCF6404503.1 hypothetical protein [Chitinophaga filiformis]